MYIFVDNMVNSLSLEIVKLYCCSKLYLENECLIYSVSDILISCKLYVCISILLTFLN